jgi:glycosidase
MLQDMVTDAGIENLLRSWLHADNHDTPRLTTLVPNVAERRIAQALLLTLPGSPVLYYGSELGMTGAGDPQNRAPMRWDSATDDNPDLHWIRRLTHLRHTLPALRYGDFTALQTEQLLAFTRTTDTPAETVLVVTNPTNTPITETFPTRIGWWMSGGELEDACTHERVHTVSGLVTLTLPPHSVRLYAPVRTPAYGYSPYDRVLV